MKLIAKLLPEMQETKMPVATFHHMGYTMFAITHDIEIGDEVQSGINGKKFTIESEKDKELLDDITFKVFSRLSPNAIWVKQGDNIEDFEVTFNSKISNEPYLAILCPTCNTYH